MKEQGLGLVALEAGTDRGRSFDHDRRLLGQICKQIAKRFPYRKNAPDILKVGDVSEVNIPVLPKKGSADGSHSTECYPRPGNEVLKGGSERRQVRLVESNRRQRTDGRSDQCSQVGVEGNGGHAE